MVDKRINLPDLINTAIENKLRDIHLAYPAVVTRTDPVNQLIDCQITIRRKLQGRSVLLPPLIDVPIRYWRSKTFSMTFPIEVGDHVKVYFCDRSIDRWLLSGGTPDPQDIRKFSLSDAFAEPCMYPQPDIIPEFHPEDLQIKTNSGDTILTIHRDEGKTLDTIGDVRTNTEARIIIYARGLIEVTTDSSITVNAAEDITVNTDANATINTVGNTTINSENDTIVNADGAVNINSKLDTVVNAQQNVNITGAFGVNISSPVAVSISAPTFGMTTGIAGSTITGDVLIDGSLRVEGTVYGKNGVSSVVNVLETHTHKYTDDGATKETEAPTIGT